MTKKSLFIVSAFLLFSSFIFSQGEGNIWYFGANAGLDFNSGTPVAITNSAMNTIEGCASISSGTGQILFYSNGVDVYDNTHNVMLNGSGLLGDESSTQSCIIVPNPQVDSLYYIFTVGENGANGLRYSEIDMSLNAGLGGIVSSSKNTLLHDENNNTMLVTEKITSVKHADNMSYWIITHQKSTDKFYVYIIDVINGFNTTPLAFSVGSNHVSNWGSTHGYMKASPGGEYLGLAVHSLNNDGFFEVFDFDNITGTISNPITSLGIDRPYGVEFSADGNRFYGTSCAFVADSHPSAIRQFDMNASNFAASVIDIEVTLNYNYMGMQLGPDGKIYVTRNYDSYLGIINAPNEIGTTCNFVNDGIYLNGKTSRYGLPTFIQSYFKEARISASGHCANTAIEFEIYDGEGVFAVDWDFDDLSSGVNNFSTLFNPVHIYSQSGTYEVSAILTYYGFIDTISTTIDIFESPEFSLGNDTVIAPGASLLLELDVNLGSFEWTTGEVSNSILVTQYGTYGVSVTNQWECFAYDEIVVSLLGIEEYNEVDFLVFPNPCNDHIFIENSIGLNYSYSIYNSIGQVVKSGQASESSQKIEMKDVSKGIYYLKIKAKDSIMITKVLKN